MEQKNPDFVAPHAGLKPLGKGRQITQKRLKEVLRYDADTGQFTWIKQTSIRAPVGRIADSKRRDGYFEIRIDKIINLSHRLAWLYVYGEFVDCIDHKNLDRADNRISNLRNSTMSQNVANAKIRSNNTSGMKGVSWNKNRRKWRAYISFNNKRIELGMFNLKDDAAKAYAKASKRIHKEFGRLE